MATVPIIIKCKCGKVLKTHYISPNNKGTITSRWHRCNNCKREMGYDIVGLKVFVYEKGK